MNSNLLIIFVKNPVLGQVKTRLASGIGEEAALEVYQELLSYTHDLTKSLPFDKAVFYANDFDKSDLWEEATYQKYLQVGNDLGQRMEHAFATGFEKGYKSICIIGSDCYQLTSAILSDAFGNLQKFPLTIGPSLDGGYYLLGMNRLQAQLFENKQWSTASVFSDTLADIKALDIKYKILPQLRDIDRVEDLVTMPSWAKRENLF